ncbi:MAG: class I SAM-dependent methyltransferase [Cyanobacteria bacterium P01_H01_bin.74]
MLPALASPSPTESFQSACNEPCSDGPCDQEGKLKPVSRHADWLKTSLFNTLDLCFDEVYEEPKKILIPGGCRQILLAQHIALLLPAAEIVLTDACAQTVKKTEEEICCRFKFVCAPAESLPFEKNYFDLTIANNFFAYTHNWKTALAEICRVTHQNIFLSMHRPVVWQLFGRFFGGNASLAELGIVLPENLPDPDEFSKLSGVLLKTKMKWTPLPWVAYMTTVKPDWQTQTVL